MVTITWIGKCPSSSTFFLLLCQGGGGWGGVRWGEEGGARNVVLQVGLPCTSQLSFLNINRYFLFFQVKVVYKQNIHCLLKQAGVSVPLEM